MSVDGIWPQRDVVVHRPVAGNRKSGHTSDDTRPKVVVLRRVMTGIVVIVFIGLLVYGMWPTVSKSAANRRLKCSVCGTTKRTLQWIRSWEDWYCWPCKEQCIHTILNALIGEHA
jgi:hypothetical protein